MEKINLLKAKEKNKNYISINSYSNNQEDIIYLRFLKENLENITNNDVPKIITNKEKMLEKLNIILKKNKIKNGENKKIMYFYKTFQKSGDCSYVPFMKIENLDNGYYKIIYFKDYWKTEYRYDDYGIPMYNRGVEKFEKLEFTEKQLNQDEMIGLVKSEKFKKLDENSLNDIVNFGFSSILDNEKIVTIENSPNLITNTSNAVSILSDFDKMSNAINLSKRLRADRLIIDELNDSLGLYELIGRLDNGIGGTIFSVPALNEERGLSKLNSYIEELYNVDEEYINQVETNVNLIVILYKDKNFEKKAKLFEILGYNKENKKYILLEVGLKETKAEDTLLLKKIEE